MTLEVGILAASSFLGLLSIIISWFCYFNYRSQRTNIEIYSQQIEDLESSLTESTELFENGTERSNDQARRIAWLEMRVKKPKSANEELVDEKGIRHSKLNITERRHRILKLASHGQDAQTIASALKMMPGEVELILNLNRQMPSFA